MKPELKSVVVKSVTENSSEVELIYLGSELLAGIDLHGLGAGLSWLKDKGLHFNKHDNDERMIEYSLVITLESDCEFRARSYIIDEDYWETNNHKLSRLDDGSIEIETDEETFNKIKFTPMPPNLSVPELKGIILENVSQQSSLVHIKYQTEDPVAGIELHGVNEGLSWLKDQSLKLINTEAATEKLMDQIEESESVDEINNDGMFFSIGIELTDTIEFKARAYNDKGDHWETGDNHKVQRRKDGTIAIIDNIVLGDDFELVGYLPLEYTPSLESALDRLSLESDIPPSLYQYLIDTSIWFNAYYQNPVDQDLFDIISRMMRFIREKQREISSFRFDNYVSPIVKALYNLYTSAISFIEDDVEILKNSWQEQFYPSLFESIPNEIEKLLSQNFQSTEDTERRKQELWEFN